MTHRSLLPTQFLLYGNDHYDSHVVSFLLAQKHIDYYYILSDINDDELADLNPYGTLPILVGKDITLYEINIIFEYLEERHQAYKLLPATPKERATMRTLAWRIQQDWLALGRQLLTHPGSLDKKATNIAQKKLSDTLITLAPLFGQKPFFLSEQPSFCDILLAPFLWRLPKMGIELPKHLCRPLLDYQQRLFALPSFAISLDPPTPKINKKLSTQDIINEHDF